MSFSVQNPHVENMNDTAIISETYTTGITYDKQEVIFTELVSSHPLTLPDGVTFWENDVIERNLKLLR